MSKLKEMGQKFIADMAEIERVTNDLIGTHFVNLGKSAPKQHTLESRFQIGDLVTITARVAGVNFSDSKVRYCFDLGPSLSIVDSEHVAPAMEVGKD